MKLLLTLLVSGQLGLFSCQWLEKQRGSHLGAMAAEFENEFADDMMQQLVAAEARSPSARRASRSSTSGDAPGTCFLCQKPLAQSQAKTFLNLSLHEPCKHAVRAHWRLLNPEEKKLDADFRKADAVAWREPIMCLIVGDGGKRPIKEHKDKLVHLTGFHEAARNKEQLLLTKKRFCKFQVFWGECEHEESASESWERRYNDSESSHRNSDDEPQVRTRGNSSITERSGRLMIKDLPGKRQGRGGGDDAVTRIVVIMTGRRGVGVMVGAQGALVAAGSGGALLLGIAALGPTSLRLFLLLLLCLRSAPQVVVQQLSTTSSKSQLRNQPAGGALATRVKVERKEVPVPWQFLSRVRMRM